MRECTQPCCTTSRLVDIPRRPFGVPWVKYAPHLKLRQIQQLNRRWNTQP